MRLNIKVSPELIRMYLIIIAVILPIISLITEYFALFVLPQREDSIVLDLLDLWSMNIEKSIPTWYSVIILFISVLCLIVIAIGKHSAKDKYTLHWWGLAILFTYLSIDEGAVIHEIFSTPLQTAFNTTGFLAFGWQILYMPLVIVFGFVYLRFLFDLPVTTRNGFILSAVLYACGALIIEGVSAKQYDENSLTMLYLSIATLEEFLEILGVSLFIYTLLGYIQQLAYSLLIHSDNALDNISHENEEKPKISGRNALSLWNPMLLVIIFLGLTNIASLAWILGQRPQGTTITTPVAFYEPMLAELEQSGIIITEAPDIFGFENNHSLSIVNTLANNYHEIYVVAFPSHNESVIFAGDRLPFDRDTLTEWLHAQGIVEFIIFDSASVNAIIDG